MAEHNTPDIKASTNEQKPKKQRHRFQKGNKFGKGNPWAAEVGRLRSFLFTEVSKGDWAKVKKALLDKAKEGDIRAVRLLLEYSLGKPKEHIELSTPEAISLHHSISDMSLDVLKQREDDLRKTLSERAKVTNN